eukprot:TRINITY_DN7745_c0_g1_i1.p1 TRINITY_DN7745_c0_g1~~TRINITY_DN7745_c0_g1_i1.p1  ORF type:complete len:454 (+),score=96.00 TRINITY_DN7745_c0_g1_i1:400-1761(+)
MDVPTNTSEDCLYLEMWTPRVGAYKEAAAVMLFFYGGDFKEGGESFEIYNGAHMSSTTNTILVVTNYRVGMFGFLYTGQNDANAGIMDQRFTMQWIQENIHNFGGDPNKVTIFGQSAGGESVLIHMSSPDAGSAKHFSRAIVESGPISLNFKNTGVALELAVVFSFEIGCGLELDIECLRSKSTKEALQAARKALVIPLDISEAVMKWAPVVTADDDFPHQPINAFRSGKIVKVPFAIGSNKNDGTLFGWALSKTSLPYWEYIAIVAGIFQDSDIITVLEAYPPNYNGDNRDITSTMINDYLFLCAARKTADLVSKAGADAYLYQFTHQPPFCPWPKHQQFCCDKVCHGDEMAYVFHDSGKPFPWTFPESDENLSKAMSFYWTSFAQYGDPNKFNTKDMVQWVKYSHLSDLSMNLKWPLEVVKNLNKGKCDMWDEVGYDHVDLALSVLTSAML